MKRSKNYILAIIALTLSLNLFAQDNLFLKIKTGEKTKWLTFSPDGRYLATAKGKKVNLWLSGTNTLTKQFRGHKRQITDLCFSPDSKYLVTVSKDKTVKIWDIEANKEIKTLQGHLKAVNSVAYSKVGNFLTTASNDKTVKIWDFETGSEKQSYSEHLKKVKCVAISPDGRYVASAGGDIQQTTNKKILERNSRIVIIREVNTGKIIRKIAAHKKLIRTLTFSPDGKYLASGGDDKTIKIWSMEDTTESKILSGQSHPKHAHLHRSVSKSKAHKGWIFDLEYSPDGKFLASASGDMSAIIWEVETGVLYLNFHKKHRNSISSLSFSPDGKYLATTEIEGKYTKLWDVSSLNIVPIYQLKDQKDITSPQIYISNPPNIPTNNRITISRDKIDIRGTVFDESGVRNLIINGLEVPVKKNGNFVIWIPLTIGESQIKIEAKDVNDNIAVKRFVVVRKDIEDEKYDAQKAKNYLFVVGINKYQDWPPLYNAVKDAENVADILTKKYLFDSTNTIVLLDSQATRNNIYATMRNYIAKVTPQDNLLIYYSGHGYYDDLLNEGYWIPCEAQLGTYGEYLPNTSILKILQNINSRHTFLVVDACFSGSLFSERSRGAFTDNVEQFKSRWGLTSGRMETVSDGRIGYNSPFATAFISFLNDNDKDKIPVSELVQHVKIKVAEVAKQTPIGNPLKNVGDEGGEFIFYKR